MRKYLSLILVVAILAPAAHAQTFVTPADPKIAFITGPQLASGDATNPRPWFDTVAHDKGIYWAARFPAAPPMNLTGTLTVTNGSATVVGVGTRFLTQIDPAGFAPYFNRISLHTLLAGSTHRFEYPPFGYRTFKIVTAVADDTHLTLSAVYDGPTEAGIAADTIYDINENPSAQQTNIDTYMTWNYYDQGLIQYINYYRTGDVQFLTAARKITDSWWMGPAFGSGLLDYAGGEGTTPRSSSVGSMILRALDGKTEYWDPIRMYVRAKFDEWLKTRRDYALLHLGVRDGSYMLLYAAQLAKCLPDSYPLIGGGTETGGAALRAGFLADVEDIAVNYYVRLQRSDGSWRWNLDEQHWFEPPYVVGNDDGLFGTMQAFHVGLLLQALGDVYFLSTNPTVKATLKAAILACVTNLHTNGPFITQTYALTTPPGGLPILGFEYFYYGGSVQVPNAFDLVAGAPTVPIKNGGHPGGIGPGTPSWEAAGFTGTALDIADRRSLAQTLYHAYGLAYYISGDTTYKTYGDLVFKGGFGEVTDADPGDGIHNYANALAQWSYNETFRAGGRYLAYRVMTPEGATPAAPSPPIRLRLHADLLPSDFLVAGYYHTGYDGAMGGGDDVRASASRSSWLTATAEATTKHPASARQTTPNISHPRSAMTVTADRNPARNMESESHFNMGEPFTRTRPVSASPTAAPRPRSTAATSRSSGESFVPTSAVIRQMINGWRSPSIRRRETAGFPRAVIGTMQQRAATGTPSGGNGGRGDDRNRYGHEHARRVRTNGANGDTPHVLAQMACQTKTGVHVGDFCLTQGGN